MTGDSRWAVCGHGPLRVVVTLALWGATLGCGEAGGSVGVLPDATSARGDAGSSVVPDAGAGAWDAGPAVIADAAAPLPDGSIAVDGSSPAADGGAPLPIDSGAPPPTGTIPGLVVHWRFDEGPDVTIRNGRYSIYDSIDRRTFGKVELPEDEVVWIDDDLPPTTFSNPYAMHLVRGGIYLVTNSPSQPRIHDVQTMSLWMRFDGGTPSDLVMQLRSTPFHGGPRAAFQLRAGGGQIQFNVSEAGARPSLQHGGLTPGWHHMVYTYDGAMFRLYVNGQLVDSAPGSFSRTDYAIILPSNFLAGSVVFDELRFYDRALMPSEVEALARGSL